MDKFVRHEDLHPKVEQAVRLLRVELLQDERGKPVCAWGSREWGDVSLPVDDGCSCSAVSSVMLSGLEYLDALQK